MNSSVNERPNYLVLDGDHKNCLAIVRHLGRSRRCDIDVASPSKHSLTFFSRFVKRKHVIPHADQAEDFIAHLLEIIKRREYDVVLPVSFASFQACSKHRDQIQQFSRLFITTDENINIAANKVRTYAVAKAAGIPYPSTFTPSSLGEVKALAVNFPCVIKAPQELGKNFVAYAKNRHQLIRRYRKLAGLKQLVGQPPIVQEYIDGGGFGFFAFYQDGTCKRHFMHTRIREYPATGGASVCAESFHNEKLKRYGLRLLNHLRWNGVAMVEFKQQRSTGEYYLMEINAKFWGSLDLALEAGVNFPKYFIDGAMGRQVNASGEFKPIRFQWLLNGEMFHFLSRPHHLPMIIADLFKSKTDVKLWDLRPMLFQLAYIPVYYFKKWFL